MVTQRRRRAWADSRFSDFNAVSGQQHKTDLLADLSDKETKTVSRILLDLVFVYSDVDIQREASIDLGIGVVSREAFDLGTFPDPNTASDYPQQGWLYVATKVALHVPSAFMHPAVFTADLRGQRKVDRGVLYMTFTQLGTIQSGILHVYGRVRALCLT